MTDDDSNNPHLTNEQWRRYDDAYIRKIAKEGAREGCREVMDERNREMGLDPDDWHEVQKDNAYLRRLREGSEKMSNYIFRSLIGTVVIGICYAVWQAIKASK